MDRLVDLIADAYIIIIIVRVVLSWISHNPYNPIIKFVYQVTEPPLYQIRRYVPAFGGLDLSPVILIIGVMIAENILTMIF